MKVCRGLTTQIKAWGCHEYLLLPDNPTIIQWLLSVNKIRCECKYRYLPIPQ